MNEPKVSVTSQNKNVHNLLLHATMRRTRVPVCAQRSKYVLRTYINLPPKIDDKNCLIFVKFVIVKFSNLFKKKKTKLTTFSSMAHLRSFKCV